MTAGQFRFPRIIDVCAPLCQMQPSACPTPKLALYEDLNAHIELHRRVFLSILKWEKQNWNWYYRIRVPGVSSAF